MGSLPLSRPERRRLILCADDFGLSDGVSAAIVDLAAMHRLSAISCMTVFDGWPRHARRLEGLGPEVAVGLHLALTDEQPLGPMPTLAPDWRMPHVESLTARALVRQIPLAEIAEEVHRQFDAFEAEVGRAPDFVDAHQHVHMLPGLREVILAVAARRAPGAWVRNCADRLASILARPHADRALRGAWLARGFAEAAATAGLRTNRSFAGYYDHRGDYAALFPKFLTRPSPVHLVVCQPGSGRFIGAPLADARRREAAALRADGFEELLEQAGLVLSPYPGAASVTELAAHRKAS